MFYYRKSTGIIGQRRKNMTIPTDFEKLKLDIH